MDWQRLFPDKILERGYDYYINDLVDDFQLKKGTLTATVQGSEDYTVRIRFENDRISEMDCTCPYAEDGNYCKHMAAVLFESEEHFTDYDQHDNADSTDSEKSSLTARDVVSSASEEMVREFLTQVLDKNRELLFHFNCIVNQAISEEDLLILLSKVDSIISSCSLSRYNKNHFYYDDDNDYHFYENLVHSLKGFVHNDIRILLNNKCYHDAFELTCQLYIKISSLDLDDFGDGIRPIAEECYPVWLEIINNSTIEEKRLYFESFLNFLDDDEIYDETDCFENVIMESFIEEEFIQKKIDYINTRINDVKDLSDDQYALNYISTWVLFNIKIMETQGKGWEVIAEYCRKYWGSSTIKDYYIECCIEQRDYDEAIRVLEEIIETYNDHKWWMAAYVRKLKTLYKLAGNEEKYREQIWTLLLEHDLGNLDLYKELKALYTEDEWITKREILLSVKPKNHFDFRYIEGFLLEDELFERLFELAYNQPEIYALDRNLDVLKDIYPKEILERYRDNVMKGAQQTSSRGIYRNLVSTLRKMKTIPGGDNVVNEIAQHWRLNYSNRRAMMDELNRL